MSYTIMMCKMLHHTQFQLWFVMYSPDATTEILLHSKYMINYFHCNKSSHFHSLT